MSTFDLAELEAADTATMHVKGPDEEPLFTGTGEAKRPVTITFHAPGSDPYVKAETKRTNRYLRRQRKKAEATAEDLRNDQVDFLVDVTAAFDGVTYRPAGDATGEDLFRAVYAARKIGFIADQATAYLADWSHFKKGSPTS